MYLENDQLRTVGLCRLCRDGDANDSRQNDGGGIQCPVAKVSRWGLEGYPLASMYAPLQNFENLYDHATALSRGTLFRELDLPFEGKSVTKGGCGCG